MPKSRKRPKKKAKPDRHAQFVETARRLGADMDEDAFKRAVEKIAGTAPNKNATPYVLDWWNRLNADTEVDTPMRDPERFPTREAAEARATVVWAAHEKNGVRKLTLSYDAGDGYERLRVWPERAPW